MSQIVFLKKKIENLSYPNPFFFKHTSTKPKMQSKLNQFFKVSQKSTSDSKKCFIYIEESRKAIFTSASEIKDKVEEGGVCDQFICAKSGLKLYYRSPTGTPAGSLSSSSGILSSNAAVPSLPPPFTKDSRNLIPLLKSNLQKAVRRCRPDIAVPTARYLIEHDRVSFLRRLPIIVIEDVCLVDSFPLLIWFMIAAEKDYILTPCDINILLSIVRHLCEIRDFYDDSWTKTSAWLARQSSVPDPTHESLVNFGTEYRDILLAIHYRSLYGGMKGDMRMLVHSIEYYKAHPREIKHWEPMAQEPMKISLVEENLEILPEAIDFHPFPEMIGFIYQKCVAAEEMLGHTNYSYPAINPRTIKETIWFAESGYNIRKPATIANSEKFKKSFHWNFIKQYVDLYRSLVL